MEKQLKTSSGFETFLPCKCTYSVVCYLAFFHVWCIEKKCSLIVNLAWFNVTFCFEWNSVVMIQQGRFRLYPDVIITWILLWHYCQSILSVIKSLKAASLLFCCDIFAFMYTVTELWYCNLLSVLAFGCWWCRLNIS